MVTFMQFFECIIIASYQNLTILWLIKNFRLAVCFEASLASIFLIPNSTQVNQVSGSICVTTPQPQISSFIAIFDNFCHRCLPACLHNYMHVIPTYMPTVLKISTTGKESQIYRCKLIVQIGFLLQNCFLYSFTFSGN